MINVALDGPSGAGKSSIAKKASDEFGFMYIDTGAMFRSLALKALNLGIDIKNNPKDVLAFLPDTTLDIVRKDGFQHMILDNEDVTDKIRTSEVSKGASDIAVIGEVRSWLLKEERRLAKKYNCIMDGRDIGSSVLPDANVKIFLTASAEKRAERRLLELKEKGEDITFEKVLEDMKYRDYQDSTREVSPLKMCDDAILVDTTNLTFDESLKAICDIIKKVIN